MVRPVLLGGRKNGQRGRPRKWIETEGIIGCMLHIRREDVGETVTLYLSGTIDLASVLRLREVAFTAIGHRPRVLCLNLCGVAHVEIGGLNTLVTISRVARLVNVCCVIVPSAPVRDTLRDTGLVRMLPFAHSLPLLLRRLDGDEDILNTASRVTLQD
jgi:anti-anti-sigma factor